MNIVDVLQLKFPSAKIGIRGDIQLADEGSGPFIRVWGLPDPQPSAKDLNTWLNDPVLIQEYDLNQNKINNQAIYDQLNNIDLKSIRPLRTNDTAKLDELEAEAVALRAQLLPVSATDDNIVQSNSK